MANVEEKIKYAGENDLLAAFEAFWRSAMARFATKQETGTAYASAATCAEIISELT